jgi:acyl transferase domain-containing protein
MDSTAKRQLLKKLLAQKSAKDANPPIAIIGLHGRYPEADNVDELWAKLQQGKDCFTEVGTERWDWADHYHPDPDHPGTSYTKHAALLRDVDQFNPAFFGISPREAEAMDPQQRLFLEIAWGLLEDAGYTRQTLSAGGKVGVFIGSMYGTYGYLGIEANLKGVPNEAYSARWMLPNRISYFFDLQGPSIAVDTACSSSLMAIHLACESLRRGECQAAIAGGVNLILHPGHLARLCGMKMLSKTGRCKPFGDQADGFVAGEGIGAVLLKPLAAAQRDGDHIHGVILATAANTDGKTSGLTVPNPVAQGDVIATALEKAGVDPRTISYVEAHGTGTSLGDPIEIAGLRRAYEPRTGDKQFCAIGSVKSNIGHLEAAAGIAGLTKVLLQMKHRRKAPSLHADVPNPHIQFEETPFYVQRELAEWQRPRIWRDGAPTEAPLRAGLSSFGAGGVNVHAIIEEYPAPPRPSEPDSGPQLIVLSARTGQELSANALRLGRFLRDRAASTDAPRLRDVAYTLQVGREAMEERLALAASDLADLAERLIRLGEGGEAEGVARGSVRPGKNASPFLIEGNAGREMLRVLIAENSLDKLGQLWVSGAAIDWRLLHGESRPARIPLPTYAFARKRYWIPGIPTAAPPPTHGAARLHPLVHANTSTLLAQRYSSRFDGQEFFFREHVIGGQRVLPGVAAMEMGRAAGALAMEQAVTGLRDVTWLRPVVIDADGPPPGGKAVDIILAPRSDGVDYSIRAPEETSRGRLLFDPPANPAEPVDLSELRERCPEVLTGAEFYARLDRPDFRYGPALQAIRELRHNGREALATLALPATSGPDAADYLLHPALLDGALLAAGALPDDSGATARGYLPFAIGALDLFGPLPSPCYGLVRPLPAGPGATGSRRKFDILLLDAAGRVCVGIRDFVVQAVGQAGRQAAERPVPTESPAPAAGSEDELLRRVQEELRQGVGRVLKLDVEEVRLDDDLSTFGFDSITLSEYGRTMQDKFAIEVPPTLFFEYTTLEALAAFLATEFRGELSRHYFPAGSPDSVVSVEAAEPLAPPPKAGLRFLAKEPEPAVDDDAGAVAIIGMAGVMPGCEDLAVFWEKLAAGADLITEVPPDRWDWRAWHGDPRRDGDKTEIKHGGFMRDVRAFDARFFGISSYEAALMDPQQRLFLETVWKAIEDAGYKASEFSGTKTGLFVGVSTSDYSGVMRATLKSIEPLTSTGVSHSILANRVSHLLNLHGPSEPVDTACSSALVAICRAVESLRRGGCDYAIAGGVNVMVSPDLFIAFNKAGMLSPDGRCKTYDASANGYVRGEGVGAILLKPLGRARADGDTIHAIIRGVAVNHCGKTNNLTAPSPNAQADVIVEAVSAAGIDPRSIGYIETHGTGTALGDPIEINGLKKAFRRLAERRGHAAPAAPYCGIGSVKTNIGHLEAAAGMAGLFKIILAMRHRRIPAHLHLRELNPYIKLDGSPFRIVTGTEPWEAALDEQGQALPRRAGLSSFGFGGVNAHLVLEEGSAPAPEPADAAPQLIVLSALDEDRLRAYAGKLADFLDPSAAAPPSLVRLAHTLQCGREALPTRLGCVARNHAELRDALRAYASGGKEPPSGDLRVGTLAPKATPPDPQSIDAALNSGDLAALLRLWVAGADVPWSRLWQERRVGRCPLPTYPFARQAHWVTDLLAEAERDPLEKMLFVPAWTPAPLPAAASAEPPGGLRVLLVGGAGCEALAEQLKRSHAADEVTEIEAEQAGAFLAEPPPFDWIYFLDGLEIEAPDIKDEAAYERTLERGALALFRLAKALLAAGYERKPLILKAVTAQVYPARGEARLRPFGGALHGLCKAMARELPAWKIACLDVDLPDSPAGWETIAAALRTEPAHGGEDVAWRGGERYVLRIAPALLPPVAGTPFRRQGVYLIIGGAGGIGYELALHLARTAAARVALVGRSEPDAQRREQLARIAALGGQGIYLAADLADLASLSHAVAATKARFGALHGVIHSAVALRDQAFRNMDEAGLLHVMAAKARGTVNLARALDGEPLDFAMFFSSAQSLIAGPGQTNYVAACAFQDAYAAALEQRQGYPVLVVNWGYWGSVGVATDQKYQAMFERQGIRSIEPAEGMTAVDRIVAGRVRRIVPFKADEAVLRQAGLLTGTPAPPPATPAPEPARGTAAPVHTPPAPPPTGAASQSQGQIEDFLAERLARLLGVPADSLRGAAFQELGIDSILGMKFLQDIEGAYGLRLYPNELVEHNSLEKLAAHLSGELATRPDRRAAESETADAPEAPPAPIFLLSSPRAGSTLLRVMLAGHSRLFAPPELHLLPFASMGERAALLRESRQDHLREGLIEALRALDGASLEDAQARVLEMEAQNLPTEEAYGYLQAKAGGRRLVDKSPSYGMDAGILARAASLCPGAFHIHLVRHPLAVMESFVRNRFDKMLGLKAEDPWALAEGVWRTCNDNIAAFLETIPAERRVLIRYEDLVADPEACMRRLCIRLGLDYEAAMLKPYEGGRMTGGLHAVSLGIGDPNFLRHQGIEAGLADAWEKHRDRLARLDEATRTLARRLGYSVPDGPDSEAAAASYGLAPAQRALFQQHGTDPVCHIVQRVRFSGAARPDSLAFGEALRALVRRHPVLSHRFMHEHGEYRQAPQPDIAIDVLEEDISGLDESAQQQRALSVEQALHGRIRIDRAPLFACALLRKGHHDELIWVSHHLIVDGVSLALLVREWFDRQGSLPPEPPPNLRFRDYVASMERLAKSAELTAQQAFWLPHCADPPTGFPTDWEKGPNHYASEKTLTGTLPPPPNATPADLGARLATALYECVAAWWGMAEPVIAHRLHRRNLGGHGYYPDVVGWFAGDVPLRRPPGRSLTERCEGFRALLADLPMGGLGYELLALKGELPFAHAVAPLRFNFQPRSLFAHPVGVTHDTHLHHAPDLDRLYLIDLIVREQADGLKVIARYSENFHGESSLAALLALWADALTAPERANPHSEVARPC